MSELDLCNVDALRLHFAAEGGDVLLEAACDDAFGGLEGGGEGSGDGGLEEEERGLLGGEEGEEGVDGGEGGEEVGV